jgi:ubiquinone/menaquinone biosynthesis C-methylase UbiE
MTMAGDVAGPVSPETVCFERAADYYDATRGFPSGVERDVAALIAQTAGLDRDARVLEIGIGTGRIALPLARHVRGVVGVDISSAMMRRLLAQRETSRDTAPDTGWIELIQGDAAHLPFPDACFDAVIGVHVLHLIPGWRDVLREIARVLRRGAPLINAGDERRMQAVWDFWQKRSGLERVIPDMGASREALESYLEETGWRPSGPKQRIGFSSEVNLEEFLGLFGKRVWSSTWRMTDAAIAELVEGLRAGVIEIYGSANRTVESPGGFWARAYTAP